MFSRHKWPTFSGILMILIMIISVFSFVCKVSRKLCMLKKIVFDFLVAFFTADNPVSLFSGGNQITGNMVKVTGMVGI